MEIVFGRVEPAWESGPPAWYSSRFMGSFALLDYGEAPFVVTDADHPFYGVNLATRRRLFSTLGGFREDLGPLERKSRMGEDTDFFLRAGGWSADRLSTASGGCPYPSGHSLHQDGSPATCLAEPRKPILGSP